MKTGTIGRRSELSCVVSASAETALRLQLPEVSGGIVAVALMKRR